MSNSLFRWQSKFSHRIFLARKDLHRLTVPRNGESLTLLFILGCQRSGTTLMTKIFEKDWQVKVYPEHSKLSAVDQLDGLRLNRLPDIRQELSKDRYPLVVMKPLVESQNTLDLLDYFTDAYSLWMFRHYKDVAASNLKRFGIGNGIKNLRFIVTDRGSNWRVDNLPENVRRLVREHFSESMDPYDAAALFWYVRNTLFFDQQLDHHPRVKLCRYADLVRSPIESMQSVYSYVHQPYPGDQVVADVHSTSIGKGQQNELSDEIEELCNQMWARLVGAAESSGIIQAPEKMNSSSLQNLTFTD